jgi:hypothetical protein
MRERTGMTVGIAAYRLRVSEPYLRNVEARPSRLAERLALRMARLYGCRIDQLYIAS